MNDGSLIIWISLIIGGVILSFMPYMTRKTENFGVSISENLYNRKDFKKMRKKYTSSLLILLFVVIIICAILSYFFIATINAIILSAGLTVYVIVSFLLYLPFHFKMKKIKQQENLQKDGPQTVVIDTEFRKEKLIYSSWWFFLPSMLVLATITITFYLYDLIPNNIPMHTDFNGNVRYDDKTTSNLLLLPAMQAFMVGLFLTINLIIKHSKQQVSVVNPDQSKQQNIMFRRRWSAYTIISGTLMVLMFGYIQISFIYPKLEAYTDIIIMAIMVVILVGTSLLALTTGQGGSRIKMTNSPGNDKTDRDDDRYWKLGQFYVNKNDPSIFVEKRFGIGWTNNWAHPLSWLLILGVITVPFVFTLIFI